MAHENGLDMGSRNTSSDDGLVNDVPRSEAHLEAFSCALAGNGFRGMFQLTGRLHDDIDGAEWCPVVGTDRVAMSDCSIPLWMYTIFLFFFFFFCPQKVQILVRY